MYNSKCPEILNIYYGLNFVVVFFFMQLFLKVLSGMANNEDPDQTAVLQEQSDLGLHYLHMPFCQEDWCMKF